MVNNKLFKQVNGVTVGSSLGLLFANFFLGYIEQKHFTQCNGKPAFYVRYVNETFVLFNDKSHFEQFVVYLYTWHKNLKFTYEIENNLILSFISVNVMKTGIASISNIHYINKHNVTYKFLF